MAVAVFTVSGNHGAMIIDTMVDKLEKANHDGGTGVGKNVPGTNVSIQQNHQLLLAGWKIRRL